MSLLDILPSKLLESPLRMDQAESAQGLSFSNTNPGSIKAEIIEWTQGLTSGMGDWGNLVQVLILGSIVAIVSFVMWWLTRKILLGIIASFAHKSKTSWDDHLVKRKFFSALAHLVPLIFMDFFIGIIFYHYPGVAEFLQKATDAVIVLVVLIASLRLLNAFGDVLQERPALKDKPIASYIQLAKILTSAVFIILMLSVITDQSPVFFLTSLGAVSAVVLLVFKDTILGFVGSIQLAANDMVRIGDWVTMEKYGADGDVIEITLATVKVQNFDKTITTIPTYSFISDSFKNWRGMQESGGRRLKRALQIEQDSVRFVSALDLEKYKKIELVADFIEQRQKEIEEYNEKRKTDKTLAVNGRNMTNIGLFREYAHRYLKGNPELNQDMTIMVRQLSPTEHGLPIEVYCFTLTKEWAVYEGVVADIFDHLLSAVNYFDLEVFERPSGADIRSVQSKGFDE